MHRKHMHNRRNKKILSILLVIFVLTVTLVTSIGETSAYSETNESEFEYMLETQNEQTEEMQWNEDADDESEEITEDSDKSVNIIYDPQPATKEDVQTAITTYETEYKAVLELLGFAAALKVLKPHWEFVVEAELMPVGYNCQFVDWDEDFGTEYYTFFPNPVVMAGFGDGEFASKPFEGPDIRSVFPTFVGNTKVDLKITNVAIATFDKKDQFGAMWAKEKLDLSMPFSTNMYLHLGHSLSPANVDKVADGMTFTMHNHEPALTAMIGGKGEGLGVYTGRTSDDRPHGVFLPNSLVIEFDTYINNDIYSMVRDPVSLDTVKYAHCALVYPRSNNLDNPILASEHKNVCFFEPTQAWIPFNVKWEAKYDANKTLGGTLTYSFAGMEQVEVIEDVEAVFGGTEVWWGFTGATGAQTAVQAAAITKLPSPQYNMDVVKSVKNAEEEDIDDKYAYSEDILTYTIRVTGGIKAGGSRIGPVSIEDKLSKYVKYADSDIMVTMSDGTGPFSVVPTVVPGADGETLTVDTGCYLEKSEDWLEITFKVKVNKDTDVGTVVENIAKAEAENIEDPAQSNTTRVTIADTSRKTVASDSAAGVSGAPVTVGEDITYEIYYYNYSGSTADLTITDALHAGVEYQRHTGGGGTYAADTRMVTWQISGVGAGEHGSVTVTVKVKSDIDLEAIDGKLVNTAKLIWSTNPNAPEKLSTQNPVAGYKVTYNGNGGVDLENRTSHEYGLYPIEGNHSVHKNSGEGGEGFVRNGYTFAEWNTKEDGSGNAYKPGSTITGITEDIVLYAQWIKQAEFTFTKVQEDEKTALPGAEFELYSWEGTGEMPDIVEDSLILDGRWKLVDTQESGNAGKVSFKSLDKKDYQLVETKAPPGYSRPMGQWRLTADSSGNWTIIGKGSVLPPAFADVSGKYILPNMKGKFFPLTGFGGILNYLIAGLGIMAAAAAGIVFLLFSQKRKIKNK